MSVSIGIIDEPVKPGEKDNLDLNIHSKSLIDFITGTSTPITVGIQGEWGSGKTSLINSIFHAFKSQSSVKQIWINSWEFSLLSTPEESLLKIVTKIIDELLKADGNKSRKDKIQNGAKKIFGGAIRIGASLTLGQEAAKIAGELVSGGDENIGALRTQLTELVNEIEQRSTNPYKKIIIYVDDLDRIEPKNAVAILELLKNIFSIPNCVFILAIDYQVVVKGLEHKFGKQTPENEWEFRAFFDKIIQLPFMMPMGQYSIGKYVNSLLKSIGFVEGEGLDDKSIREIIIRTIGGNPRSIKRLANSISLIQIFVKNKKEMTKKENAVDVKDDGISSENEKFLLFALLCLQIAYPPVYSLLVQEPDFQKWDEAFAFKQTNGSEERTGDNERLTPDVMKKIFDAEFKIAKKSEDFKEDWEKALFRICYGSPRLKSRVSDISKFFSYIKDELLSDKREIIGETISRLLTQTSVTSVTSTDGEMNARSKALDASQQNILADYSTRIFAELKAANSIVFGTQSRTNNITGSTRMRKKELYKDTDLNPLWVIEFCGMLQVNFGYNYTPEINLELVKYFDSNIEELRSRLPGKWEIDWKDGQANKTVSLFGPLFKKTFRYASHLSECDEATRMETIKWAVENVPKFEQVLIKMCNEFFEKNSH